MWRPAAAIALVSALSCNGTTGYGLVTFHASARGFSDATAGQPYAFDTPSGVHVTITRAILHIGAMYLTQSVPQAGGGPEPCELPQTSEGAFVGEVRGDGDVDLLDPSMQPLQPAGEGSTIPAATAQVWLIHASAIAQGNLNGASPPGEQAILTLEGTFADGSGTHTFAGAISIEPTRISGAANTGLPGEIQICQQRIVGGIPVRLTLAQGGTLAVGLDAKRLFNSVAFSDLPSATTLVGNTSSACLAGVSTERCFTNDDSNVSSRTLFSNLKTTSVYRFDWLAPSP